MAKGVAPSGAAPFVFLSMESTVWLMNRARTLSRAPLVYEVFEDYLIVLVVTVEGHYRDK